MEENTPAATFLERAGFRRSSPAVAWLKEGGTGKIWLYYAK